MDLFKFYEIFIEDDYKTNLEEVGLVLDIGANKGYFCLRMAEQYPNADFICYEPEPANFDKLQTQLNSNGIRFTAYQEGVSDSNGEQKLFLNQKNDGGHSLFGENGEMKHVKIQISNLDTVFERLPQNTKIDLMKLDCEGAEKDIILSITKKHTERIENILYEPTYSLYDPKLVNSHLLLMGYKVIKENGIFKASKPE